tara:strand:- start:802287 stop:803240 length:954 start_codon:yes stop_codon:yes gene_type:complete
MKTNRMNHVAAVCIAAGIACSSIAIANDTVTTTIEITALERLETARIAFEAAKAELALAQAEYATTTGTEIEVVTTNNSANRAQPDTEPEVPEDPSSWSHGWAWEANVGITGASGNTENLSARAALSGQRNTSKYETKVSLSYIYGTTDSDKSTSRGQLAVRNDWLTDSKWRYFAEGKYEYDEFQIWEHRLSAAGGVGYEFIDNDKTTLIGRAGLGASYETGGTIVDEEIVPEGLVGLDWTHQYSENTKLTASTTYYPNLDDFGEFRWNNSAGIEVVMDKESGMTLNAGIEHRHDSDPGAGFQPNDVNYYMGLGWKF